MSMDLEEYVPETMAEGDKLKPSDVAGNPLIIKVLDYQTGITTKYNTDGDGEAVVVDVFDMSDQTIHLQVLWFNAAIRDNLKAKVGKTMPISLEWQNPKKAGGNKYLLPVGLTGEDLETARAWAKKRPALFDEEREAREFGPYKSRTPGDNTEAQGKVFTEEKKEEPAQKRKAALPPDDDASITGRSIPDTQTDDDDEPPF